MSEGAFPPLMAGRFCLVNREPGFAVADECCRSLVVEL
jgi:hypothetical protein